MTIVKSNVAQQIVKHVQSDAGTIHFFNHIAVVEFGEGIHADLINGRELLEAIMNYFGNSKPFGLVANRVNSYSIALLETKDVRTIFPNLVAYGIVSHDEAGRMNAAIESNYCSSKDINFDDLYVGLDAVYKRVLHEIPVSLN